MKGIVVRRAGDKTVVLETTAVVAHPLYSKKNVRSRRYLVHDAANKAELGQVVTVRHSRPLSARKRWIIVSYGSGTQQTGGG
ncbi:MAG: 30S ribosomal protein S17 [Candidatus Andersenbacteria bacterium]|nr:30S ribosomal protein S17 [Candidatus Andersenbacteria bacterium]